MKKYHVGAGIAGVYAGKLKKNGEEWADKSEVTDEAMSAVAQYLMFDNKRFHFQYNGKWYVMKIEEVGDGTH